MNTCAKCLLNSSLVVSIDRASPFSSFSVGVLNSDLGFMYCQNFAGLVLNKLGKVWLKNSSFAATIEASALIEAYL